MNTPAHIIFGMAAFSKPASKKVTIAAAAGGLLPDLSLYLLAGWSIAIQKIPVQVVFEEKYFSREWMNVFRIDNSFLFWGLLCAISIVRRWTIGIACSGAALLHLALDLPLHHDDGRPHFWPLSNWVFQSPLSYWDRNHGALWIAPLETALVLAGVVLLFRRHQSLTLRVFFGILATMQVAPMLVWIIFDPGSK